MIINYFNLRSSKAHFAKKCGWRGTLTTYDTLRLIEADRDFPKGRAVFFDTVDCYFQTIQCCFLVVVWATDRYHQAALGPFDGNLDDLLIKASLPSDKRD